MLDCYDLAPSGYFGMQLLGNQHGPCADHNDFLIVFAASF